MLTIRDIAKMAGVSRSTVSLVLNNSPRVKEDTRNKVNSIIQQVDYIPNNSARSLNTRTVYSLGIIVLMENEAYGCYDASVTTSLFSQDVTVGISNELAGTDYSVVIEHFCYRPASGELPRIINSRRVDGAFVVGGFYDMQFIDKLLSKGIPAVMVGGRKEEKIDSVIPDPEMGVFLASQHLLHTGHKNLCLINSPKVYHSSYQRVSGIERSLKNNERDVAFSVFTCGRNTAQAGYEAMEAAWRDDVRPDGIIAANAPIAAGVLRFLAEKRIRVPEDVSLIAHEDSILCGHAVPALTATNTRKEYMGEIAAQLLLSRLQDPQKEVVSIVSEPFLVIRDSVLDRRK